MKRNTYVWRIAFLALIGFLVAGVSKQVAASDAAAGVVIKIDNFSFGPQSITVPAGTQVTWINQDDIPHTVVSEDKATFKSRPLDTDEKFSFTFTKPGTYTYFCSIHPKMAAKVIVQ